MRAKQIGQRDLAKRIEKDQATLSRYLSRKSIPNVTTANKIALATGGAVKPSMWSARWLIRARKVEAANRNVWLPERQRWLGAGVQI